MTPLSDLPCLFLSYKEPNADKNYAHLLGTHPKPENVRRVHGVSGFDSAHKMCALMSWCHKFVMLDGDTQVLLPKDLYRLTLETLKMDADDSDRTSICFSSVNSALALRDYTAGVSYGNGGVKVWSRNRVLQMLTHENSPPNAEKTQVEFCYEPWYRHSDWVYSVSVVNATLEQAFRAGFREGYKLSEFYGLAEHHKLNDILTCWMTMSADVDHGAWSMVGARAGFLLREGAEVVFGKDVDAKDLINSEASSMELLARLRSDERLVVEIDRLVTLKDPARFEIRSAEEAMFYKSRFRVLS